MRTNENSYLAKLGFMDSDRKSEAHDKICIRLCNDVIAERLCQMVRSKALEMGLFVDSVDQESWVTEKEHSCTYQYIDSISNKIYGDELKKYGIECNGNDRVKYKTTRTAGEAKWRIMSKKLSHFLGYKPVYFDVYFQLELDAKSSYLVEYEDEITQVYKDGKDIVRFKSKEFEKHRCVKGSLVIEVKNKRQSVTDCIQQLNTYREFMFAGIRQDQVFDGWHHGGDYYRDVLHKPFFILATAYNLSEDDQNVLKLNDIIWIHLPMLHDKHWI